MLAAVDHGLLGAVAATIILVLLIVFVFLTREKRHRVVRVGFFLEREKFPVEDEPEDDPWKPDPGAEGETLVKWPGEEKQ